MSSFRRLAIKQRKDPFFHRTNKDPNLFLAVILELAHAISRGRRPTGSSLLPGVDFQQWLQSMFFQIRSGYRDYTGKECSVADDIFDGFSWDMSWDMNPDEVKMMRAIKLVEKTLLLPRRLPSDLRGDPNYQQSHRMTSLKRRRAYNRRFNGSHYDPEDYHNYSLVAVAYK